MRLQPLTVLLTLGLLIVSACTADRADQSPNTSPEKPLSEPAADAIGQRDEL